MARWLVLVLGLTACASPKSDPDPVAADAAFDRAPAAPRAPSPDHVDPRLLRKFQPLEKIATESALVDLGRMLFFDKRLSRNSDRSCSGCHHLGIDRSAPAALWGGRAVEFAEQAKGALIRREEMAMPDGAAVERRLKSIPGYQRAFELAFPGDSAPMTYANAALAIAGFERGLVRPSRWDRYLTGELGALSQREVAGVKVFTDVGCVTCHRGRLLGVAPRTTTGKRPRQVAKVPAALETGGLRNIVTTAPYFHDGSAKTLEEAVATMAKEHLDEELSREDIDLIVAWFGSLTGELPAQYIREPGLP